MCVGVRHWDGDAGEGAESGDIASATSYSATSDGHGDGVEVLERMGLDDESDCVVDAMGVDDESEGRGTDFVLSESDSI